MRFNIIKEEAFAQTCSTFVGGAVYAEVVNSANSVALWDEIDAFSIKLRNQFTTETIKQRSGIAATRLCYKALGKDPSRYRPACEQLARRILQNKALYHVDTLVDLVNFASLFSGYSTAALDADEIKGTQIKLGVGRPAEPYEAIGRGELNIENLPVYRDETGAFATPTSDSTRTMLSLNTTKLLVLINAYDGDRANLRATLDFTVDLLKRFASCTHYEVIDY